MNITKSIYTIIGALILMLTLCFTGCSNTSTIAYSYSPPTSPDGRVCVDECKQAKNTCTQLCSKESPQCIYEAQQKAQKEYQAYVEGQQMAGKPVSLTPDSFYNDTHCAHTGCGCEHQYDICYQLCGTRTVVRDPLLIDN